MAEASFKNISSLSHKITFSFFRSRAFLVPAVWIFFILAASGTFLLSRSIENRANNAAAAFLGSGNRAEIALFADRAEPNEVIVKVGDEVVFVVKGKSKHNIAEDRERRNDARLESGEFGEGESYSLVFQKKGAMSFYDRLHQDIRITVRVE